ncbi:ribosomal protein S21e [Pelagophyceae sp. CCMP2097]|nr:ribosomal protein S21e [Pelagophyceae sp. CCMP2097]|eukprot:CAMPEP_0184077492 /NCGR_PEP_ID=MMETSP0974-20121125/688_1 /TAXON_ID=483370 /ORGANISM="non described non described, Strain CCMP2097" /LENGTH=81 /DNA_ID=CAMNT_0026380077 /DNA_START=43 /DNA_END=288 /DNA_ORIENTATION=-
MQNEAGVAVDLYIPRKCSWTSRVIQAHDKASVQINVGSIDPNTGLFTNAYKTFALSGYVRSKGESDMALTDLCRKSDEQSV